MYGQLYFAYGSNLDTMQMEYRCPHAKLLGKAMLPGHRFVINELGVATIIRDSEFTVWGVLWRILPPDEHSLDQYEGVGCGFYYKQYLDVFEAGSTVPLKALIYVAENSKEALAPRYGYLEMIIEAGKEHGFPEEYIYELSEWFGSIKY